MFAGIISGIERPEREIEVYDKEIELNNSENLLNGVVIVESQRRC